MGRDVLGRVAEVTGAALGIGAAAARDLARQGARLSSSDVIDRGGWTAQ